ncbi:MAG: hypothetical protein KG012_07830 [Deltaproteobacteria bacterium]|nr:hypothetical protein [Deltaproteobacteria bacterium]
MLQKEYEKLVEYLEEMIADGCQLVHGGNLIDWHDTKIPKILQKIKTLRDREAVKTIKKKKRG